MNVKIYNFRLMKIITVSLALILSGCATLDESDCLGADWNDMGAKDASEGHKLGYYSEHISACSEYGIRVDTAAYKNGWKRGIKRYCTKQNGWNVGYSGGFYENSCPSALAYEFNKGYKIGYRVNEKRTYLDSSQNELDSIYDKLSSGDISRKKRRKLNREKERLRNTIYRMEYDLRDAEREASRLGFY